MAKTQKVALLVFLVLMMPVLCLLVKGTATKAETIVADTVEICYSCKEEATPYGLYTKLNFTIGYANGEVNASVKNTFTLFSSTVTVYVDLFWSETYQESYINMSMVATRYIHDLDQGKTITVKASTDGKQGYWQGRAFYRIDSGSWQNKTTDTFFYDSNGTFTKV